MKHVLSFVLSLLCAVLLVAVLRIGVFDILTIPLDGQQPVLMQGDRVLVNKWAYGWRRPFSQWWGYERYAVKKVLRGDWIAFNRPDVSANALPDSSQLCVGQVLACPGDTIWMGMQGRVSMRRDYARGCIWPLVVPARAFSSPEGKGHRVMGRNKPALMPCSLAIRTAVLAILAVMP